MAILTRRYQIVEDNLVRDSFDRLTDALDALEGYETGAKVIRDGDWRKTPKVIAVK